MTNDYVDLQFGPRWTYISCVRRFLAGFFLIGLSDKERAEQISMAASELLENAVKYAAEDEGSLRIAIKRAEGQIDLCVRNPADAAQINILRREFALINNGDPETVYLRRMEEAAKNGSQSRLGLIRIRYEAGATLKLETAEREVAIHALFPVEES